VSIPYPPNFNQDLDEERHEQRYAMAVRQLGAGDVIAEMESLVPEIADPAAHPLFGIVTYYMDAGGPETGRVPWNLDALAAAYDPLVKEALSRLIDEKLADFSSWEA
jgi:hypothetical protein